ncbi:MAG: BBP7 family outer membrane beta-barrel protein [Pirellulales bacterium]|nr:BBP7 family outer membrane beta-barrel protein [Pirellulales bacterium]
MRRSFQARAAYATAPWIVLLPTLLAHGQTAGPWAATPPNASGAFAPPAAAAQGYLPQNNYAAQTVPPGYGVQPYAPPAYASQPTPAPMTATQPAAAPAAAAQPYTMPWYMAQQQGATGGQTTASTPVGPGPMYTAQAEPQLPSPQATPQNFAPAPMTEAPRPMASQQPTYDPATDYGYPPAAGDNGASAWSAHACNQQQCGGGGQCGGYGAPSAGCNNYYPAMNCAPPILWEAYGGALLMFRDKENHQTFSYDSALESNQYLDYRDAQEDFLPGFEVGVRRFNCCTCTGWEALYWGLFPSDQTTSVYANEVTGNLDPILDYSQIDYNGASGNNYTNAALIHRLQSSTEVHNAEINRLWGISGGAASPWSVRTLAGFRYFNLQEGLQFAADTEDTILNGDPDELYYTIDTENNLYGGQLGALLQRRTAGRWSFNAGVKAGVFCNDASARSSIGGAAGTATINNGPNAGQFWFVDSDKSDVSFLGELRAGVGYQIGQQWRLLSDYRVLGVSGLAMPTNQIYPDLRGINDVRLVDTSGSLFLHGVFVGAERVF